MEETLTFEGALRPREDEFFPKKEVKTAGEIHHILVKRKQIKINVRYRLRGFPLEMDRFVAAEPISDVQGDGECPERKWVKPDGLAGMDRSGKRPPRVLKDISKDLNDIVNPFRTGVGVGIGDPMIDSEKGLGCLSEGELCTFLRHNAELWS